MWETLRINVKWDYFKILILPEILKTQNLHQVEHCAYSEVIRFFQSVGCVQKVRGDSSLRDKMEDLDVNTAIWCIFMSVTLQAALHLGTDCTENSRSTRNPVVSSGSVADH